MKKISIRNIAKQLYFPKRNEIQKAVKTFSTKDWFIVGTTLAVMLVSVLFIIGQINKQVTTKIPAEGGSLHEGIVGTPRFINPVLALSDPDKDLTRLVYSGLMRADNNGSFLLDLAESYEASNNGLVYTFILKDNITFHDGTPVTAEDVVFTIERIQDPLLKSPLRVYWQGVTVEAVDRKTVTFTLRQPYISFLSNTTVGILPSHLWENIPTEQFSFSDRNLNAIGSGPYKISSIKRKSSGVIDSISLKSFKNFALGRPHISELEISLYPNEQAVRRALETNSIQAAHALSPSYVSEEVNTSKKNIAAIPLARTFTLFFNSNKNNIFSDKRVREALELAIDKETIIELVLSGFGSSIDHPIPKTIAEFQTFQGKEEALPFKERQQKAEQILDSLGWRKGEDGIRRKGGQVLSFSISTGNAFELQQTAEIIREYLSLIGVQVELKVFEIGNLNQNIIRPRDYEALFFGQIISREADLYAFWHSDERQDPGLNIAMYTNSKVDDILEELRTNTPTSERFKLYANLQKEIEKDKPSIFVYSPDFIYIIPKHIKNITYDALVQSEDRFNMIHTWYIYTDSVWNIFLPKN